MGEDDSSQWSTVRIEASEGIGRLVLDRPGARNALNLRMNRELAAGLRVLDADRSIRVIVLSGGDAPAFCAGADLTEAVDRSVAEFREEAGALLDLFETMARCGKPVIASVHSHALAGGFGLVAASDLAIACDDAVFGLPEIKVARFPLIILPALLRSLPRKRALELAFTGDRIGAQEALAMGLVNRVVPHAELEVATMELALKIASASPTVLRLGREAITAISDQDYFSAMRSARETLTVMSYTADGREGVAAFVEKRKPSWTGG
jgi:enoyl-CoA hydratase/carnithine racemase